MDISIIKNKYLKYKIKYLKLLAKYKLKPQIPPISTKPRTSSILTKSISTKPTSQPHQPLPISTKSSPTESTSTKSIPSSSPKPTLTKSTKPTSPTTLIKPISTGISELTKLFKPTERSNINSCKMEDYMTLIKHFEEKTPVTNSIIIILLGGTNIICKRIIQQLNICYNNLIIIYTSKIGVSIKLNSKSNRIYELICDFSTDKNNLKNLRNFLDNLLQKNEHYVKFIINCEMDYDYLTINFNLLF